MTSSWSIQTCSPEATQQVGRIIGEQAQPGDIYLLTGPLGAGKTCLTQGIGRGLDVAGHPRSPTFVLMARYPGRLTLHHMDLYRISDPLAAWDLGLEEYLSGDGVCVIEWADQAADLFVEDALWINLDYAILRPAPEERSIGVEAEVSPGVMTGLAESGASVSPRTITFGQPSPRYASLLDQLSSAFPKIEIDH